MGWMQRLSLYLLMVVISAMFCKTIAQQIQDAPSSPSTSNTDAQNKIAEPVSEPFVVRDIIITGNKKTKPSIILREIPFKPGDHFQLQQLVAKFEDARK